MASPRGQIAELSEDEADEAANALVKGSLLRVLERDRRRFQIHALLREQLRARAGSEGLSRLRERHAVLLEALFKNWETRWQDCRECLEEVMPAAKHLLAEGERERETYLAYYGYELARRIGEYSAALVIATSRQSLWQGREDTIKQGTVGKPLSLARLDSEQLGRTAASHRSV